MHELPFVAAMALGLLSAGASRAQAQAPQSPAVPAAVAPSDGAPARLSAGELSESRAGQTSVISVLSRQQLDGTTSNNSIQAGTLTAGAVSFSSNALQNYSGVGNFVINTGANNTLQGSISVNIVAQPPP